MKNHTVQFEQVRQLIKAFLAIWPDAEWGAAHCVLSDYNLSDGFIQSAVEKILKGHDTEEKNASVHFLRTLLEIPETEREPDSEDF